MAGFSLVVDRFDHAIEGHRIRSRAVASDDEWDIEPGTVLRRTEVHARFGGNRQSGIAPIANSKNVLIFTGKGGTQYGYDYDGWRSDGAFHYTGEGKKGSQKLTAGNKALATPGRRLHVFREVRKAYVEYIGEFETHEGDAWYLGHSLDVDKDLREVIVFKLWPLDKSIAEEGAPPPPSQVRGAAEAVADLEAAETDESSSDEDDPDAKPEPEDQHHRWASDSPADDDTLNREGLAQEIAKRLGRFADEEPESSFLIHVDGPWGSGKSTLLKLLDKQLKDDYLVVHFDAWKHARVDPPWWALLTSLRAHVSGQWGKPRRLMFRGWEALVRACRGSRPFFATFFFLALAVLLAFLFIPGLLTVNQVGPVVSRIKVPLAAVATVWLAVMTVSRFVWWDSARGARRLEQVYKNPMHEVNWYFGWLLGWSKKRVVFFIDDLDRCDEKHVVEIMDSIQTIVRDAPKDQELASYFVVAAHGSWLRRAYEAVREPFNAAVEEPGRGLGHLFLNKLFQLTVPMPTLSAETKKHYFNEVLGVEPEASEGDAEDEQKAAELSKELNVAAVPEDFDAIMKDAEGGVLRRVAGHAVERLDQPEVVKLTEHSLQKFAPFLDSNPRSIKRFVNTYSVLRAARYYEGIYVNSDVLAYWLVLQTRWPVLTEYLEANLNSLGVGPDKEIRLDLLPEKYRPLLEDPEFRHAIEHRPVDLTPDDIRACCGAHVDDERERAAAT